MKKTIKRLILLFSMIFIFILIFIFDGYIIEKLHKDDVITSTEQLGIYITEQLNEGNDSCNVYLKYMSEEELLNINEELDGFFGSVKTYRIIRKYNKYMYKAELEFEISDNYYVYRGYKYGDDISGKSEQVKKLYNAVCSIIDNNISENMSDYEKEVAIHDYIVKNCVYDFLEGDLEPYSYKAYGALVENTAVCNGYAEAMELILMCMDIDCYIVVGEADGVAHAWNLVKLGNNWYHIDATWDDPVPDQGDIVSYAYVNLNDEAMSYNHKWNNEAYPKSISMNYNYYMMQNGVYTAFPEFKSYVMDTINSRPVTISAMVENFDSNEYDFNFVFSSGAVSNVSYSLSDVGKYTIIELVLTYY